MINLPLARVYFDTNILYRWPHVPNDRFSMFGVANWLKTNLYFPKAVEDELERQFVRSVADVFLKLGTNAKELAKLGQYVIELPVESAQPSEVELREAFRVRSDQLKAHFGISTVPLPSVSLATLLDRAINRKTPFQEHSIGNEKNGVVGFQDAVIAFSVIEHLKGAPKEGRYAFISNDDVFHRSPMKLLFQDHGVKIELFRKVSDVFENLWEHVWGALRDAWYAESKQVEYDLNNDKVSLANQILPMITLTDLGRNSGKDAKEIKSVTVGTISLVRTELPAPELRPPQTAAYSRPEGSSVNISASVIATVHAIVENYSLLALLGGSHYGLGTEGDNSPKLEDAQLYERLNVSLVGEVRDGKIGNWRVTGVQVEK